MEPFEDETNYVIRGLLAESDSLLPGMGAEGIVLDISVFLSYIYKS